MSYFFIVGVNQLEGLGLPYQIKPNAAPLANCRDTHGWVATMGEL